MMPMIYGRRQCFRFINAAYRLPTRLPSKCLTTTNDIFEIFFSLPNAHLFRHYRDNMPYFIALYIAMPSGCDLVFILSCHHFSLCYATFVLSLMVTSAFCILMRRVFFDSVRKGLHTRAPCASASIYFDYIYAVSYCYFSIRQYTYGFHNSAKDCHRLLEWITSAIFASLDSLHACCQAINSFRLPWLYIYGVLPPHHRTTKYEDI